jgi:hypothetical protein
MARKVLVGSRMIKLNVELERANFGELNAAAPPSSGNQLDKTR